LDGGAEKSVQEYALAFKSLGFHVSLICQNWEGSSKRSKLLFDDFVVLPVKNRTRLGSLVEFTEKATRWINENPSYIIQSHEWVPGAQILRLGDGLHSVWLDQKKRSGKFVLNVFRLRSRFDKYKCSLEEMCLHHPNLKVVIVNSKMVRNELLSKDLIHLDVKVELIRNIVSNRNMVEFPSTPSPDRIVIGFVGSGWERKNLALLLRSIQFLGDRYKLLVAGTDKRVNGYRRLASRLGVSSRVSFLGIVEDMDQFYRAIDCLAIPSLYDPFPNVSFESMAFGKPVVVTGKVGTSDFRYIDGVFVAEYVAQSFADSILEATSVPPSVRSDLISFVRRYDDNYLREKVFCYMSNL